ncbi:DNA repair protein RecN [Halolactibacillus alkaliphilus]|uniref:DNA repair protein RecN n=1 Tax=Halolactibacillus alkaliphilus TaxID=442899 RepID=A0A511X2Q6_9BACI|nr:DNA repair protein RecN [Halolactibacillus alkaliphilus]GEN57224.1 DNA repair protein RecN [Halolactibacillus alkaliphilus]GGN68765.1 DNA repair protein RecN [Halolactibacillus alkaliphilus]SFO72986.1 DNA repair protein RecN (Recombination protein N) [Halolactibacillus alkaliphilus]
MLTELSIRDFAIIDHLQLQFKEGLTVLTGETGAGKSIIIDAIQLLAGGRGSVEFVKHGAKKASLEGLFALDDLKHPAYKIAENYGVEIDEAVIILHRTISDSGKSICRVNGTLVTLGILKEFGRILIDIHTQHETQSLMNQEVHIELLDLFDQQGIGQALEDYQDVYRQWKKLKDRLLKLQTNEQDIIQRLDLLKFQLNELQSAELVPNEDVELNLERDKLSHAEKIFAGVTEAYQAITEEQRANDWLTLAQTALVDASDYDASLGDVKNTYLEAFYMIEDVTYRLRDYLDAFEFNPDRLNMIESRLNELSRLMRKYGTSVDEMIEYQAKISDEIEQLEDRDGSLSRLKEQVENKVHDAALEAEQLHHLRMKAKEALEIAMRNELADLYLEKAKFQVEIKLKQNMNQVKDHVDHIKLSSNGNDHVQFLLSTNPGEPIKPLNKVASGGELSRIMLALKKIFAKHQGITSVIFDEVDTGVSGRVAQAIAEKIASIASGSQVLCITHLPQVAAMADTHVLIEKKQTDNHTHTTVNELTIDTRTDELARMMTGKEITETSRAHALSLIEYAEEFKKI